MKKQLIIISFALILSIALFTSSFAQDNVYTGDVWLNSQSDVTNFGANNYTGCTGFLKIASSSVVDLTPLSSLKTIGGYIQITNNAELTSLSGLENITSVGGYVQVTQNVKLTNLDGLKNLTSVGGFVWVTQNAKLTNIDGLESLTSVGGNFAISNNPALTDLDGLVKLTSVGDYLSIQYNASLINISGLANLTSVGGYLAIESDASLTNINGLENLSSVSGNLSISSIDVLQNLDGLTNLTSVGGEIHIWYNASLTNLDGLANLTSVGGAFYIQGNSELTNLDGLESLTSVGGQLVISQNPKLVSFCGLYTLFSSGQWNGINFYGNGYNYPIPGPIAGILNDGPCTPSVTLLSVDIYPETCPNSLNVKGKGVIPVAILGTDVFDVQNIDPTTLMLEGVSPLRWSIDDVATPISNGEQCDCITDGPDGFDDFTLKFDAQELVAALGQVNDGDELVLKITGNMLDGTPIEGSDCVKIIAKNLGKESAENLSDVPKEYTLYENYPNPFNPSTIIKYELPKESFVALILYDVLGREVATLVNKYEPAGKYEIEFNASNLPSGIYIYRLKAGDFNSTKKMILQK